MRHTPLLLLAALCALFSACQVESVPEPTEETYAKSFFKNFGPVASTQTWNMATRQTVTVTAGTQPADVKVFVKFCGKYRLAADYKAVSGTRELAFDAPQGTQDLLVKVNHCAFRVKPGAHITPQSATRVGTGNSVVGVSAVTDPNLWYECTAEQLLDFDEILPEKQYNRGKVANNFMYVSHGPFILYPIFWNTSQTNTVGIYYYDADYQIVRVPVYKIKNADGDNILMGENPYWNPDHAVDWPVSNNPVADANTPKDNKFVSKGILIDIAEGTRFGMYIDDGQHIFYSEQERNPDPFYEVMPDKTKKFYSGIQSSHAATFTSPHLYQGNTCLAFEDWYENGQDNAAGGDTGTDNDLNDVVVLLKGNPLRPTVEEQENALDGEMAWVLATEDLGDIGDFDFNDVVVRVSNVAGTEYLGVKALAAGGRLPVSLSFNGATVGDGRFHAWFGDGTIPETTFINTSTVDVAGKTERIAKPDGFTMEGLGTYANDRLGGFAINVEREDGTFQTVKFPGAGQAPQMICVPEGWAWPKERVNIHDAYPQFAAWQQNPEANTEWYKTYAGGNVCFTPHYRDDSGFDDDDATVDDTHSLPVELVRTDYKTDGSGEVQDLLYRIQFPKHFFDQIAAAIQADPSTSGPVIRVSLNYPDAGVTSDTYALFCWKDPANGWACTPYIAVNPTSQNFTFGGDFMTAVLGCTAVTPPAPLSAADAYYEVFLECFGGTTLTTGGTNTGVRVLQPTQ